MRTGVLGEGGHVGGLFGESGQSDFQPAIAGHEVEKGLLCLQCRATLAVRNLIRFPVRQPLRCGARQAFLDGGCPFPDERDEDGADVRPHVGIAQARNRGRIK